MATILRNARMFDGGVRGVVEGLTLTIDGEQIVTISAGAAVDKTGRDLVVDCAGKTVLPGLLNCHAHLGWDGYGDLEEESIHAARSPVEAGIRVAYDLRGCLEAGVTTIRDLGVHHTALAARAMLNRGVVAGPRIFSAGAALARTGGHTWWCAREADGPDDVRRAVREQIRAGADWIKVMATGHKEQEYTDDELRAAADEAHALGVKITAHATFSKGAKACILAGYDGIEHGGDYTPEVEDLIVERGVWITPTLSPLTMQARHGEAWGMNAADVERRKKALENPARLRGVARLKKKGAKLAFGTDSGSPVVPHNDVVSEMEALLEFGVFDSVDQILTAATSSSAAMLGIGDRTGTLEPGKRADIVIVDGDPLKDVRAMRNVHQVFVGGRLVVDAGTVLRGR